MQKFNLLTLRIFLQNVDIFTYAKVMAIERWQGFGNIGEIPYKKNIAFFQFKFYAPPLFENSTACRGLKICTQYHTMGFYKSDAAIF